MRNPALLLLDEPTANLDAASERRIAATLASLCPRTTVVAMIHRSEPAKLAHNVVLLKTGRVAGAGRWSELEPTLKTVATSAGRRYRPARSRAR